MAAQWPRVAAWLLATAPTLTGWDSVSVYDGPTVTGDQPTAYLTVGFVGLDGSGGAFNTTMDPDGFQYQEFGNVRSQMTVQSGDTDVSQMGLLRGRLFTLTDALDAKIRADRTLGGTLSPQGTADLTVDVLPTSNRDGTALSLSLTLNYFTVT